MNQYFQAHPVNTAEVIQFLTCPLCGGLFRDAQTINECNHTFCKSCILKFFFQNIQNSHCPVCLTQLGGRPLKYLVNDTFWQELTDSIFPEFKELDREAMQLMHNVFEKHDIRLLKEDVLVDYEKREKDTQIEQVVPNQNQTLSFIFFPWCTKRTAQDKDLKKEKTKSTGKETPPHIEEPLLVASQYMVDERVSIQLLKKLIIQNQRPEGPSGEKVEQFESISNIELYCNNLLLNDNHSLAFVLRTIWVNKKDKPIEIVYKRIQ